MNAETPLMKAIRSRLSHAGAITFRNNVGALTDSTGRYVQFGLCKGSGDIIMIVPVIVTQEMVGRRVALFGNVEVKRPGADVPSHQQRFIGMVREQGGIAFLCRDDELAEALLSDSIKQIQGV